jgi:hypothetical protein
MDSKLVFPAALLVLLSLIQTGKLILVTISYNFTMTKCTFKDFVYCPHRAKSWRMRCLRDHMFQLPPSTTHQSIMSSGLNIILQPKNEFSHYKRRKMANFLGKINYYQQPAVSSDVNCECLCVLAVSQG